MSVKAGVYAHEAYKAKKIKKLCLLCEYMGPSSFLFIYILSVQVVMSTAADVQELVTQV
jgi:hypothetical protein